MSFHNSPSVDPTLAFKNWPQGNEKHSLPRLNTSSKTVFLPLQEITPPDSARESPSVQSPEDAYPRYFQALKESNSKHLLDTIKRLEAEFTVPAEQLKTIAHHFRDELTKGLSVEGGNIPMIPTWVCGYPTQDEKGIYLAMDMGGTNLRVCEIELLGKQKNDLGKDVGTFDLQQSKYRIPKELLTGDAQDLFGFLADCLKQFIEEYHDINKMKTLHLGFTFSYPCTQEYIDHGVLQRWTKGFDVPGVEGHDVVPMLENELKALGVPITVAALINDTTGTLIASRYTDNATEIGCIFGTGCNAAYMDRMGDIPKLAHMKLDPDMPIAINCEWGAFDNEHKVLPLTPYDTQIDKESPRPGQQTFEKMVSGLYIGEIFRLVLVDLAKREDVKMFEGQDISRLKKRYSLDAGFMSAIEEDPFENLLNTRELFEQKLDIDITKPEAELIRRLSEMIGTRAARLSACGIAAVCMRKKIDKCTVGADGSVVNKYPGFKDRVATALKQIYDWKETHHSHSDYPIHVEDSEDGSGVGAALIAALTKKRVEQGNLAGIQFPENYR